MHTAPEIAIILGTGLGNLVNEITDTYELDYKDIPGFPVSTVEGHKGRFIFGRLGGKDVMAMQGRFHYYEGYEMEQVTYPIRVMRELGIKTLFVSNASGGMNPDFRIGDLMIIRDHINLASINPLIGVHHPEWGTRFPDMSEVYNQHLSELLHAAAKRQNVRVMDGVYAYSLGPAYETPAEISAYRSQGADVVGMSTVPEAVFARSCGMRVAGISLVSNLAAGIARNPLKHEEVMAAGIAARPSMAGLIEDFVAHI